MRDKDPNLKTQLRFGELDLEMFTKTRGKKMLIGRSHFWNSLT